MTDVQERRVPSGQRVTVSTLVEVCGNAPGTPVFEAESIDVSPRGMHLRTAYLPEEGAPLVCRFENEGGEIVVEGVVAWRRESGRGGEFGVKFTALDSHGVDSLRELCATSGAGRRGGRPAEPPVGDTGARVRLHIDGLGSPMKARVRSGGESKVQVGSNLEFLKVGRRLELEDLDLGGRRSAWIDGVSVLVDPSTQIPQLVVGLRYENPEDHTPSPTVAPAVARKEPERGASRPPAAAVSASSAAPTAKASAVSAAPPEPTTDEEEESGHEDEPALRGRVASFAANAEVHAKAASERLASASSVAAQGAARWLKGAAAYASALGKKRPAPAPRRVTAPPPGSASSSEKPKLRAQSGASSEESPPKRRLSRKAGITLGAASVLGALTAAWAFQTHDAPPPRAPANNAPSALEALESALPQSETGNVTAHVPLFGPTPLTTTEAAPLGPPLLGSEEQLEHAEATGALRGSAAKGEVFQDERPRRAERGPASGSERVVERDVQSPKGQRAPEDVAPWGRGRMNLPVIHRLRLDAPGAELEGTVETTGFTITIPNRKVMEPAAGIANRDARIARTRATNTNTGAQVSFRFKESVPGYRVRLRRDYVEILISSPEKGRDKGGKGPAR